MARSNQAGRIGWLLAIALPLTLSVSGPGLAQGKGKIADKNPDTRAEGVEEAARGNNKAAAQAVLEALATENDGPAGFRMADAVTALNSPEALDYIEKTVLGWNAPEKLFGAYWCFCGLARMNNAKADGILKQAATASKDKEIYIKAAAIEALGETGRSDLCGLLVDTISKYEPDWDKKNVILTLTCVYNAPKLAKGADTELRNKLVLALADVLEKTDAKKDDRIQYFVAKALAEITGEDTYTDPAFWRWWVQMGGKKVEKQNDGATVAGRDVPKFFKAAAVGKRVMFVIDISGSMQHPVNLPPEMKNPPPPPKKEEKGPVTGKGSKGGKPGEDAKEEEKKPEIPPPDYSKVVSKLDLAKVELIHCLKYLPEDYKFNIVIYHTSHDLIDPSTKSLVPATQANKDKFIKKVQALNWAALTNIHGAMIRGFCVNEKGMLDQKKAEPGWDPECMNTGATTIFFLTDGTPTISDDTTDTGQVGTPGGPMIGNGRMCDPAKIALDIKRVNTFRRVVINTIGIGPHDGRLLQAMAAMSGGEYVDRSGLASRG